MQKLLTIVVPVYKVEPYINKCLDSCLIYKTNEQGEKVLDEELMNQLEVIIVNDGTPDNSAEMSREYVKRYPQTFRQIDKENGGHGSAWNVGLKEATGKYLRFLDSDDWLTNLDKLMLNLDSNDADLVFTDECVHYFDTGIEIGIETQKCSNTYNKRIFLKDVDISTVLIDGTCINFRKCTYLSRNLKKQLPLFREKVSYDDTILYAAPWLCAEVILACDFVVYNYLWGREDQSMNLRVMLAKTEQSVRAYVDLHNYIVNNVFHPNVQNLVYRAESSIFCHCFGVVARLEYKRRKKLVGCLLANQPCVPAHSKLVNRYIKLPFGLAYLWDNLRWLKEGLLKK